MKKIILGITGSSASGKSTLMRFLTKEKNALQVVTATSRQPRSNEKDQVDYYFLTNNDFLNHAENFLEINQRYDYYYGTPWNSLEKTLDTTDIAVIVLDSRGVTFFKEHFKDHPTLAFYSIYLETDNIKNQFMRMVERGDSTATINQRIKTAKNENEYEAPELTDLSLNVFEDNQWQQKLVTFIETIEHTNQNKKD